MVAGEVMSPDGTPLLLVFLVLDWKSGETYQRASGELLFYLTVGKLICMLKRISWVCH